MGSKIISQEQFMFSTDIGFVQTVIKTVSGYGVEDLVRNRSISQARAVQLMNLGKSVDPSKPLGSRTISSMWLNNSEEL